MIVMDRLVRLARVADNAVKKGNPAFGEAVRELKLVDDREVLCRLSLRFPSCRQLICSRVRIQVSNAGWLITPPASC